MIRLKIFNIKKIRNCFVKSNLNFTKTSLFFLLLCFDLIFPNCGNCTNFKDSVVKIFVTSNSIDFYRPWQSKGISSSSGSGCIIEGNKILTNAHVVTDNTFVQVKKDNDPKKYTAKVINIGHDCDLAILTVDDERFFKDTIPISLGELPKLQDTVTVMGYPQGGDKLSITEGVVSRIEVISYSQSSRKLLSVQIDAAINPGNSGGPVIQNDKLVGVSMQVYRSGQNIGYVIPVPIINHFFDDLKDNKYDGFPLMGIEFNNTENSTLRDFYKINEYEGGIIITKVLPYSPAYNNLKEEDVVLAIDDIPIGEDGTFNFREDERLIITHLITQKQIGDNINLEIIRKGIKKNISFKLNSFISLVPNPHAVEYPNYLIHGGLVFTTLTVDLLKSWGNKWWEKGPIDFNYYLIGPGRLNNELNKEKVVLLNVLPDDINVGYHLYNNEIVVKVNGKDFTSFKEFVSLIYEEKKNERYTSIETENNYKIIIDNKNIDEINEKIIKRNNIPFKCSKEVSNWIKELSN